MSTEDVHTSEMAEVQTDNDKEVSSNHDSNITGALHFTDVSHINSYVATKQPSLPRHENDKTYSPDLLAHEFKVFWKPPIFPQTSF
ncbi:hypothetical protein CEXT_310401 [Caerostris extrusa]|uniref:Uncharacterized protein n=1 Tax=Caerostris extrusa TaxID=172846 RepID=A0AAV4UZB0_CAEEX|nr:hypothetical protein CEXT_310401 [Caerostris extrusa]